MENKKVIKLTESDLEKIINKVISEDAKQQFKNKVVKITEADLENIVKRIIDNTEK